MAVNQEDVRPEIALPGSLGQAGGSARRVGLWLATAGWIGMGRMWLTGSAEIFGHDQEGMPAALAIGLFLTGWLVMVAAMMLPSSLPTLGTVDRAQATQTDRAPVRIMLGYFWAWAVFGAAAFAGDSILHRLVASMPWLAGRPSLVLGGIAMFAGAAEALGRTPPPMMPATGPGAGSFRVGKSHAVDRIRRCWPVMLFAMAVGMNSPVWMVSLTCVMTLELRPRAQLALRVIGVGIFALGAAVILQPDWMPVLFGTGPEV
jgi:predicted metal-binding membrane protein